MSQESMRGAIDLSGLAEPHNAPVTQDATGHVPGEFIVEVSADNLREVLELSVQVPVLLFVTTTRAENASQLEATLRQLATTANGAFQLGIVDADKNLSIAQALRLQGIPAGVGVLKGQPFTLFEGIPEASELGSLLQSLLSAAQANGVTGTLSGAPGESPLPPHMKEAYAAMEAGNYELAEQEFTLALKENPGLEEAKVGLAHLQLLDRVRGVDAQALLEEASQAPLTQIEIHMRAADVEVAYGRADSAFARLIDVIKMTAGEDRNTVRERLLELFEVVGPSDKRVQSARRALANALF